MQHTRSMTIDGGALVDEGFYVVYRDRLCTLVHIHKYAETDEVCDVLIKPLNSDSAIRLYEHRCEHGSDKGFNTLLPCTNWYKNKESMELLGEVVIQLKRLNDRPSR